MDFGLYLSAGNYLELPNVNAAHHVIQVSERAQQVDIDRILTKATNEDAKLLFRLPFFRDSRGKKINRNDNIPTQELKTKAEKLIGLFKDHEAVMVTLDEENVPWNNRAEQLEEMYWHFKRQSKVSVYQWYSGSKNNNAAGEKNWPLLSADGWVFDQYSQTPEVYEKFVKSMSGISNKLTSILWLSPNWDPSKRGRSINNRYWREHGHSDFVRKIKINNKYSIQTIFFTYFLDDNLKALLPWSKKSNHVACAKVFTQWFERELMPILSNGNVESEVTSLEIFSC